MKGRVRPEAWIAAVLLCACCVVAQSPEQQVRELQSDDVVTAEIARRSLLQLDKAALPTEAVVALLGSSRRRVREDAISVLMHHGVGGEELRRLLNGSGDPGAKQLVLPLASDDQLGRIVATEAGGLCVEALGILEDRGALKDALLIQAVRSENEMLRTTACRILVLERSPFALPVAEAALDTPARQTLLELLAERPRPGAGPWLMRLLDEQKLVPKDRLLAIQALPAAWMNKRLAREVVVAAGSSGGSVALGTRVAAARFSPELADAMVPVVLHQIQSGSRAGDVLPCLVRATSAGERELLNQGEKLGRSAAAEICAWLASRQARALEERILGALAGESRLESYLLRLTGPYLKTSAQVAKVVQFLDGDDDKLRILAYDELLEAKVYHASMLDYALAATEDRGRRAWRLLNLPRNVLPEDALLKLLATQETTVVAQACQLLAGGKLSGRIETRLLELVDADQDQVVRQAAQRALLVAGSEAAGTRVWNDMSPETKHSFGIDCLITRPRVWSREFLLKERQTLEDTRQRDRNTERYYHRVLLALCALGDRGAAEQLLAVVHEMEPDLLRRSKKALLEKLTDKQAAALEKLLTGKDGHLSEEQRVELLEWVEARPQLLPNLENLLRRLWKKDPSYEVRLGALRGLLRGPGAGDLYKEVTAMFRAPLDDEQEEVVLELVGSLGQPLSEEALDFLAKVVLLAPLANPRAEVGLSMVAGWEGTRGEYPMLRPVANLLRRDDKARPGKNFGAVAKGLPPGLINRRRLGLFLSLIAVRESLFRDLGPVLARTILTAPDRNEDFLGPAHLVLGEQAEQNGDDTGAARHFRLAGRYLLRRQQPRFLERAFLGEADALLRYHPLADLAARPHLCEARVFLARRDWAAAKSALAKARDLAAGDEQAMNEVTRLGQALKENSR